MKNLETRTAILLPEGIVSPTPYDDVFRTMISDIPRLIIPLINELFGTHYSSKQEIVSLANELFLYTGNNRAKRITDSNIGINGARYHIECQSTNDGTIIIRMFQYDVNVAIQTATFNKNQLNIDFPHSAVLFLRCSKTTPDTMTIKINTPGGSVSYNVEVLKIKNYSIEELFEKQLYFLLPFYAFNFENKFAEINENEDMLYTMVNRYNQIIESINHLTETKQLTSKEAATLVEMMKNTLEHLTQKYENIQKEVETMMCGKIIKTQYVIAEEKGIALGEKNFATLISALFAAGRTADAELAANDEEARKRFYKEFGMIE